MPQGFDAVGRIMSQHINDANKPVHKELQVYSNSNANCCPFT